MAETVLVAVALTALGTGVCPGPIWSDPAGDQLDPLAEPPLDVVAVGVHFEPGVLTVQLSFDPAETDPADLMDLSGFIDFDVGSNAGTGDPSHIDQFALEPSLTMGVDYFLLFWPFRDTVELYEVVGGNHEYVGEYPVVIEGSTVKVNVPRCSPGPCAGIDIGSRFQLSVLIGNSGTPCTDRAPNDGTPYTAVPAGGDLDEDGDVDGADIELFKICISGPNNPQLDPECEMADLDRDEDVDQDDFGILQRELTGTCY